jgi:hypothetical protein
MLSRALLAMLAILAVAQAWAQQPQATQRMYKCVDAKGKVYYTQLPPAECLGRASEELNKQGAVVKRNEAPLTPEQKAKIEADREAERKRKADQEMRVKEERRQSQALLNTYSSEKDIEEARVRALKENEDAVKETERRIQAALKRQKELNAEREFFLSKPLPKKLNDDIQGIELELKTQQEALEARRKQASTINARYDDEKRRYLELTRGKPAQAAK